MSLDAMKQALEALEECTAYTSSESWSPSMTRECEAAITALRAAIEQAQEPVAWVGPSWLNPETRTWESESFAPRPIKGWIPLYTAPRQWQGLTDEERIEFRRLGLVGVEIVEAKLKEKNA